MSRPVIHDPDPAWPARARELGDALRAALGPDAVAIEHIGSTSIPGMAAKDILDMQVSVADLAVADGFDGRLAGLGFARLPYERDHVPVGLADDPAEWAKRFWVRRHHRDGDVNLHVRRAGSPNERLALLFREWFRAHPAAVAPYAAFKRALAAVVSDVEEYSDVKDPVVDLVIWMAEEWATRTAWAAS